ncbi:MAG: hypothetical protein HZA74_02900 [Ignavibacteriales bacterium]|nr:hypothetical protein [Ignavibacteriales bacterium]
MDLYNDINKKNNYTQPQNPEKENPLSEEKIEEFKTYIDALDKKIEEKYGLIRLQERLNVEKFKKTIAGMGICKTEGILKITDNKTRKLVHLNKIKFNNEPSGEDALASLNVEMNDRLKIPWLRRVNLFDIPFQIAIRENENKKCVDMTYTFRNFKYSAIVRLVIREIIM